MPIFSALPEEAVIRAFTPEHLQTAFDEVHPGESLLVVGFPLGFHDTLHHLPVVRQAVIASSFGLRFQGQGQGMIEDVDVIGCGGPGIEIEAGATRSAGESPASVKRTPMGARFWSSERAL